MPEKKSPPSVDQSITGDDNIQIVGDDNTIRQQVTKYIPIETDKKDVDENVSRDITSTTSSTTNQTIVGDDNIQIIGSNNIIQRIINFFRIDTEQQRALKNRYAMLELVKNTWIKDVLEKSLYNEVFIELGMEERSGAVDHPWDMQVQMPDKENRALPAGTSMMEVFDEMNGAILILGEPGSGKTTMLLELARDCIERAQQDDNQPIPVVFNLSSWDGRQTIVDWLVDELRTKYNVPEKAAQGWVENDELQLLLDGLDEVKQENREACVKTINAFRQEHGLTMPIAVCSRVADYKALTKKLNLSGAILLQPLTTKQIEMYFTQVGPELGGAHQMLKDDDVLLEMAKQPLTLSILALAYHGKPAEDFTGEPSSSIETRRRHLFDTYVHEMFSRAMRTKNEVFNSRQTRQWLSWLAQKMIEQGQSTYLLENMQSIWLNTSHQILFRLVVGLFFGLYGGAIGGIFDWFFASLFDQHYLLLAFVVIGLVFGYISGQKRIDFIETLNWDWKRGLIRTLIGFLAGSILVWIGWLIGENTVKFTFDFTNNRYSINPIFVFAIFVVLFFVPTYGILGGINAKPISNTSRPGQGTSLALRNYFIVLLITCVVGGLICGLIISLVTGIYSEELFELFSYRVPDAMISGLVGGFIGGLLFGLIYGQIGGLKFGGLAAFKHYLLRFIIARNNFLPFRLVPFLDYCVDRIFLRRVGGGYIFVHRLLMEHFAAMYAEDSPVE